MRVLQTQQEALSLSERQTTKCKTSAALSICTEAAKGCGHSLNGGQELVGEEEVLVAVSHLLMCPYCLL